MGGRWPAVSLWTNDVRILQGGFSGWTSSKLQTKMSNTVSAVEILAPVFGTVRKAASPSNGSRVSNLADKYLASAVVLLQTLSACQLAYCRLGHSRS